MFLNRRVVALIAAAGKGERMKTDKPKQYLNIKGKKIIEWTIGKFDSNKYVDDIVLIVNDKDSEIIKECLKNCKKNYYIAKGGNSRAQSVYNGLCKIQDDNSIVLIHDGVRPFISQHTINRCIVAGLEYGACVPAVKMIDTIKMINDDTVEKTVDRNMLISVQTPQAFTYEVIKTCYDKAIRDNLQVTDDASIVENYGQLVKIVRGERKNIKITTPFDLIIAEVLINYDH